jgi:anti-sigma factor RsiW
MNCELAHERIVSAAYGELLDEEIHELERHIDGCPGCQAEREQVLALKVLAGAHPVEEPEANLIARARLRLDEALDALPPRRFYERWAQRIRNGVATLQAAPVAALLLLLVGVAGGGAGGFRLAQRWATEKIAPLQTAAANPSQPLAAMQTADAQSSSDPQIADVANVTGIKNEPANEEVQVSFNQLVPRQVDGSLDSPLIRQLLMMASENSDSARVRSDSVGLLADECRKGHSCQPTGIRDVLMIALHYDTNAEVREKALQGLEPYVAQDVRVRDAVLEALMTDSDAKIRTDSINLLEPVEADTSVRQVLYSVSTSDDNPQIRNVSRQILSQVPEIQ